MANSRLCSVSDCNKPAVCRGWCNVHYYRWKKHGDATAGRCMNGEQWQYMLDHMNDPCPKWPYLKRTTGRGVIHVPGGSMTHVHQVVCEMVHGPAPAPDYEVAHNCGKGHEACFGARCVEWKTRSENQMDRVLHGTSNRGSRHGSSKLTEPDVRAIRLNANNYTTQKMLASTYGVKRETIRDIQNRRIWAWLD